MDLKKLLKRMMKNIAKLLLDLYNKYKLNAHDNNTLKLDIKEKMGLDKFDLIIEKLLHQLPLIFIYYQMMKFIVGHIIKMKCKLVHILLSMRK